MFGVLDDLVKQGKLLYYGVSVEKVEEGLKALEYPGVQSVQIIFNIFRQRPAELFFEQAQKKKVGILARVPLASGLLSGKMSRQTAFAADDHRLFNRHGESFDRGETFSGVDYEAGLQAIEELRPQVPPGMSMAQMALRWILMYDGRHLRHPGRQAARSGGGEHSRRRSAVIITRDHAGSPRDLRAAHPPNGPPILVNGSHGNV